MNRIHESMKDVKASRELKAATLQYLEPQRGRRSRPIWRRGLAYALVPAMCLLLLFVNGWHYMYRTPISFISMDVNPSIELEINRFGRVVAAEAYNEDAQNVLRRLSLKNKPYVQAVRSLLEDGTYGRYLKEDATLVFTIVSDNADDICKELDSIDVGKSCNIQIYSSDSHCMEEAHLYNMSFGKYRAYLELAEYDGSVTVEQCHGMSMGEIQERIAGCRSEHEQHHGAGTDTGRGNMSQGSTGGENPGREDTEQRTDGENPGREDTEQRTDGGNPGREDTGQGTGRGNSGHGHHGGHHNR